MVGSLESKTALITGAGQGIGRAIAVEMARQGASAVAVADHNGATVAETAELVRAAGAKAEAIVCDLRVRDDIEAMVSRTAERFDGLDVLVNVAGGFRWERVADGGLETWDQMYSINLRTAVVACKAALAALTGRGGGRIVNVGAGAAGKAAAGMGAYTASKAGVQRLTESLAAELRDANITVNAILPGTIDTPRNRADMPDADFSRWVAPREIADVIAFLVSDSAVAVTGAAIPVFGRGWS